MKNSTNAVSAVVGLSFPTAITIVFLILKLAGSINWSWLWVLSPLWIVAAIYAVTVLMIFVYFLFALRKNRR